MISATGRFTYMGLSEIGRYVKGTLTETGDFAPLPKPFVSASLGMPQDMSGRMSAGLAHPLDLLPPISAAVAYPQAVGNISAAIGNNINLMAPFVIAGISAPQDLSIRMTAAISAPIVYYAVGSLGHDLAISGRLNTAVAHPLAFPVQSSTAHQLDMLVPIRAAISSPVELKKSYVVASQAMAASLAVPVHASLSCPVDICRPVTAGIASAVSLITQARGALSAPVEIQLKNMITASMSSPLDMGLNSVIFPAPVYSIYLAGKKINGLVATAEIKEGRSSVHADFSISFTSQELYRSMKMKDPLTIVINGVTRDFVLEEVNMTGGLSFKAWGRSASCLLDSPHHEAITIEADGTLTAAGLAASLAGEPFSWTATDYPLPDGWSMTGTPIAIITRLAATVGALVQPSGLGIAVVPSFPVRPVNWNTITPVAAYTREVNIMSLSWDDEARTPWNSVQVSGRAAPWQAPMLEVEEQSPAPGDTVHVRVYRKGLSEVSFANLVTAGIVRPASGGSVTVESELVQFSDYRASLRYPPDSIVSISWVGDSRGTVYWLDGGRSTELELSPGETPDLEGGGLAIVTYRTSYERYRLSGHNVQALMMICTQPDEATVKVKVKVNGEILPEAEMISDELATNDAAAVAAGVAWLDGNRYSLRNVNLTAPHDKLSVPGSLITLADEIEDVSGPAMVDGRTISISGPSVVDSLEVFQCLF